MAAVLSDHIPIFAARTVSGQTPQTVAQNEKASQTFLSGVPVMLSSGVIKEWDTTVTEPATATAGIAGIARSPGANLASDGKGAPGAFTGVGAPAAFPTYGSVQFQSSAVNFVPGSPFTDGRTLLEVANADTVFVAQFDDAGGSTTNATTARTMIGKHFGLTKDTTGHWYVDFAKSTQGTNTVVIIVDLYPTDGAMQNGRVMFKFEQGICQLAQA